MNYRGLIAPFIDFRRAFITTDSSIRKDINTLNESITFFEHGDFSAPNEEYFSALEAHLSESLAASTTKNRISLTRKFFTWTQKGDAHMQEENTQPLTESIDASNEEAQGTLFDRGAVSTEPENAPSKPTVDADTTKPPHEQQEGAAKKSSKQQIKITVYPDDKALETDIKDLADLEGLPVSKFILKLIKQEVNSRREDLNVLRRLRAKRG